MPGVNQTVSLRVGELLQLELARLGRPDLEFRLCLSDATWRETMAALGCEAWNARLRSPTTRRGTRGKLGMATVCHLRHRHPGVVYIRTRGRPWDEIEHTIRHEAIHLARPSFSHRQIDAAMRSEPGQSRQ